MNIRARIFIVSLALITCVFVSGNCSGVTIGSKKFTENVIIAEMITLLLEHKNIEVVHRKELGGTRILWDALTAGDIDVYPEYTGTLVHEIFAGEDIANQQQLESVLKRHGVSMSGPLGFNNTYILGIIDDAEDTSGIRMISDLKKYPDLRLGFSNEFMARADGWPGLKRTYQLRQEEVAGMDHDLAYRGLADGRLDVIDLYATDAEISYYGIRPLIDDRGYFPDYLAVILYRNSLIDEFPGFPELVATIAGRIDSTRMSAMNAEARINRIPEDEVAAEFLRDELGINVETAGHDMVGSLLRNTRDHLVLVLISLSAAILIGIPLGIVSARHHKPGQVILAAAGMIQTIPSLALLVFMIPLLGIGGPPAVVALFLYSLLPIIRNTYSGLHDIPAPLLESAVAMGLPSMQRLRLVEIPLAMRSILSGIKISAVINIGTATLGALIGAGGYGQPILTGIRLNDVGLILQGAVPAALLALLVSGLFDLIEKAVIPKALRVRGEM